MQQPSQELSDDRRAFYMRIFTGLFFLFLLSVGVTSILGLNELITDEQMNYFLLSIIITGALLFVAGGYFEWKCKFTFLSN